jgi:hypothetical protein
MFGALPGLGEQKSIEIVPDLSQKHLGKLMCVSCLVYATDPHEIPFWYSAISTSFSWQHCAIPAAANIFNYVNPFLP